MSFQEIKTTLLQWDREAGEDWKARENNFMLGRVTLDDVVSFNAHRSTQTAHGLMLILNELIKQESEKATPLELVKKQFDECDDNQRLEMYQQLTNDFCIHCGSKSLPCNCWRDE